MNKRRDALFAVAIIVNYDGTATMMTDVVAKSANRTQTVEVATEPGKQVPLIQFDTTLPDCSENKDFKALVPVIPKLGSISAITQNVVSQYPPGSKLAACNGQTHRQLVIFYSAPDTGSDMMTIRASIGGELVDVVYLVKSTGS